MDRLRLFGVSHLTAPVELREKIYIPESRLAERLAEVKALPGVSECVILSTCNRTEIYLILIASDQPDLAKNLLDWLVNISQLSRVALNQSHYELTNLAVVEHLMKVASGLDSMIVGEGQVLRQVKESWAFAQSRHFTGPFLNTVFNRAISAGKRARTETEISRGAVSVSSAAVQLAKNIFKDLSRHQILIIGAGKMSELAAKQLIETGVKSTLVSNRTFAKAEELAKKFAGQAVRFDELEQKLTEVDIVISSTGAPHFLLKKPELEKIMSRRQGRPIFLIDIAVPRDVDPEVGKLEDVFLYDIDDLGRLVEQIKQDRTREIPKVMNILAEEQARLLKWKEGRAAVAA